MRNSGRYSFKINTPFADAKILQEEVNNYLKEEYFTDEDETFVEDFIEEDYEDYTDVEEQLDWEGMNLAEEGELYDEIVETECECHGKGGNHEMEYEDLEEDYDGDLTDWPEVDQEVYDYEENTSEIESLEEQFMGNLRSLFKQWSKAPEKVAANLGFPGQIVDLKHLAQNVKKGTFKGRDYYTISMVRNRNLSAVKGIVLHQMAFNRDNDFNSYLKTGAHYIILRDGKIGQLYAHDINLNASNGFNNHTLAVEFAGNFPNDRGKWWHEGKHTPAQRKVRELHPTREQIQAGKFLLRTLINDPSLPNFKHVYAHRQSSASRSNDPGPDIWCQVAEWAIKNLGYQDASQVVVGSGQKIPSTWKKCDQTNNGGKPLVMGSTASVVRPTENGKSLVNVGRNILGGLGNLINVPRIPDQFRGVTRRGAIRGLSRYGDQNLDHTLIDLRKKFGLNLSDLEIDLFQRIANVETSGKINGINTWDSGVVSLGFMQLTLRHGKLQRWIKNAAREFQRYGIYLSANSYAFGKNNVPAIQGVNNPDDLRWGSWALRFYTAGLDEKIIIAEIEEARYHIKVHLRRVQKRLGADYPIFYNQYQRSAHLRGIFQAAYNNLPLAAKNGTYDAVIGFKAHPSQDFVTLFAEKLKLAYRQLNDPEGAGRLIQVTGQGSALV